MSVFSQLREEQRSNFALLVNIPNLLFALLLVCLFAPGKITERIALKSPIAFLVVILLIEAYFLIKAMRPSTRQAAIDIASFVFGLLLVWECVTSKLDLLPYIFLPPPENAFYVFVSDYSLILRGFVRSMGLLICGYGSALASGVFLGLIVGWVPRLRKAVFPIAKAISTVPAMIYSPYLVVIMPTFTSASILVIFCGIFWSTFMTMINNVAEIDQRIINAAKILNVNSKTMIFEVIFPYTLPRIINNMAVSLSVSLMTLTVAEMIGADRGMGYFVKRSLDYANYPAALAGIFFIAIVITALNALISLLRAKLVKWSY